MNLSEAFKSIVDLDDEPIVITDMDHKIVYLNPTAQKRYKKYGGASLIGRLCSTATMRTPSKL